MLALSTCGLTANVAVGVMARAAAEVSVRAAVRAAARAAARADAKAAARNKPMRLIGSRLLSQLSVAVGLHRVPCVTRCDRGCLMFPGLY